jgi:hypothetical protein
VQASVHASGAVASEPPPLEPSPPELPASRRPPELPASEPLSPDPPPPELPASEPLSPNPPPLELPASALPPLELPASMPLPPPLLELELLPLLLALDPELPPLDPEPETPPPASFAPEPLASSVLPTDAPAASALGPPSVPGPSGSAGTQAPRSSKPRAARPTFRRHVTISSCPSRPRWQRRAHPSMIEKSTGPMARRGIRRGRVGIGAAAVRLHMCLTTTGPQKPHASQRAGDGGAVRRREARWRRFPARRGWLKLPRTRPCRSVVKSRLLYSARAADASYEYRA